MGLFRQLRILFLLLVLLLVALNAWLSKLRTTDWDRPLVVALYPVNGDGSAVADSYIAALDALDFQSIEEFFRREAGRYGLGLQEPFDVQLARELAELPPLPPLQQNPLAVMWWSLKMRYWAWSVTENSDPPADIRMFVLYHDPVANPRLAHSLGLQKGLLGVVHAFASRREAGGNQVVIAHELLHTLGATDKYDLRTNLPLFPAGYAQPGQVPLLPQHQAEIMAGRIPLSATQAIQARELDDVRVGKFTALEIRWIE